MMTLVVLWITTWWLWLWLLWLDTRIKYLFFVKWFGMK